MARSGAITFKGKPLTLAGNEVKAAAGARFQGALLRRRHEGDHAGRPQGQADDHQRRAVARHGRVRRCRPRSSTISSARWATRSTPLTVSLDLPFAMNRFCGAENIKNMRVGSDYQDRNFGNTWGTLIEELKIMPGRVRARRGRQGGLRRVRGRSDQRARLRSRLGCSVG